MSEPTENGCLEKGFGYWEPGKPGVYEVFDAECEAVCETTCELYAKIIVAALDAFKTGDKHGHDEFEIGFTAFEAAQALLSKPVCGKCGVHPKSLLHTCPYRTEIYDDQKTRCNCCDSCMDECAGDV